MSEFTVASNSLTDVNGLIQASTTLNGDTVKLLPGSADWGDNALLVNKAIILQGAGPLAGGTTITHGGGIAWTLNFSPTYEWGPRNYHLISTAIGAGIGHGIPFAFQGGNPGTGAGAGTSARLRMTGMIIENQSADPPMLTQFKDIVGLVDHCLLDSKNNSNQWAQVYNEKWYGGINGHGSFEQAVQYGSADFVFFEDCLITYGGLDSYRGGRYVVRHCRLLNGARPTDHGTEADPHGIRAKEVYNCWFSGVQGAICQTRSGTSIFFNNIVQGKTSADTLGGTATATQQIMNYRNSQMKNNGAVRGENPTWIKQLGTTGRCADQNTPLANPSLPASSTNEPVNGNVSQDAYTAIATNALPTATATFTDTNAAWTPGQWRTSDSNATRQDPYQNLGYSYQLVNVDAPARTSIVLSSRGVAAATIMDNTANTLTIDPEAPGNLSPIQIAVGDRYAIRMVVAPQDMPGMGQIDATDTGLSPYVANTNITPGNCTTPNLNSGPAGVRPIGWQNQQIDPIYDWNNWTGGAGSFAAGTPLGTIARYGNAKGGVHVFTYSPTHPVQTVKPGYPNIASPTTAQRQVGASGVPGQSDSATLYNQVLPSTDVYGYQYPYIAAPTTPLITSSAITSFTAGQSGQTFTVTVANFSGTPTFAASVTSVPAGATPGALPTNVSFSSAGVFSGSATGAVAGTYQMTITATYTPPTPDEVATQSFSLVINAAAVPPTVTLDTPSDNDSFVAPATITLTASASSSQGSISKVEFYRGGTNLIGTVTSSPYTYIWTGVAAGSYSLTAKAYDNLTPPQTATSSAVNITVTVGTTLAPPTIAVTA